MESLAQRHTADLVLSAPFVLSLSEFGKGFVLTNKQTNKQNEYVAFFGNSWALKMGTSLKC